MATQSKTESNTCIELGVTRTGILQEGVAVILEGIISLTEVEVQAVLIQMGCGSKPKRVVVIVGTLVICLRIVENGRNVITAIDGDM